MPTPEERHAGVGKAIEDLFNNEPVAIGTAVSTAVTGTLTYLSHTGYLGGDDLEVVFGLLTLWLPIIGLIIRSQYTPYARREEEDPLRY